MQPGAVSRLMALAIHFDQLIRDGVVADYADLARLGRVTRARVTQIMNLLNLAPDIQEEILFLAPSRQGQAVVTEKQIRPMTRELSWPKQRNMRVQFLRERGGLKTINCQQDGGI